MRAYGETWKIKTARHWHKAGNGKAFNLNLYQNKMGLEVWFADFKDQREDGSVVTSYCYNIGLAEEMDMQAAFRKANALCLAGADAYDNI